MFIFTSIIRGIAWLGSLFLGKWGQVWIFTGLSILGPLVSKIISLLGFTSVALIGINLVTDTIIEHFLEGLKGLPLDILLMLGIMKIDIALSLIVSALTIKQIMRGWDLVGGGRKDRHVWGAPNEIPFQSGKGRVF